MTFSQFIGVDGCRGGWIACGLKNGAGQGDWAVYGSISALAEAIPAEALILVDMPIGLPEKQARGCDRAGRRLLGRVKASSIFPVPARQALSTLDYASASQLNVQQLGVKLSKQTWNILPKIRELDDWLQSTQDLRFRECHPELALRALNGGHVIQSSKKTAVGLAQRLAVLQANLQATEGLFQSARQQFPKKSVADDDLVDALILAVTGWVSGGKLARVPEVLEQDATGLPMEIVFACK